MKKSMEFGLLVAMSALAVLAAGTVLRDAAAGPESAVDRAMWRGIRAVAAWAKGTQSSAQKTSVDAGQASTGPAPETKSSATAQRGDASTGPLWSAWSAADTERLGEVVSRLQSTVTPAQWTQLTQSMMEDTPTQAAQVLNGFLHAHLSSADATWLAQWLPGQSVNATDIAGLRQLAADGYALLTPEEQSRIQALYEQWLSVQH
ncbi:hypothetical protein GCM10025857_36790 [Alicyclobacillus contaminans]|uniref:hypothetical protein n=1 Tax=Alicyclobacillus contaminans TaxID=392016 RepID=UPI0003F91784|nr:hypothetical protein [Alicyclobacillus contaminans]GMA52322.1 hypothetical protein GCM10025857_36790 [Alicyclobacillus contaminans]